MYCRSGQLAEPPSPGAVYCTDGRNLWSTRLRRGRSCRELMAQRGRPRRAAVTLAGLAPIAPAPQRSAPKLNSRFDLLELFHSQGLMPWFDVAAARIYQRVMTATFLSSGATIGKAAARVAVQQGDARRSAATAALDGRTTAAELSALVVSQLGAAADATLRAFLVDGLCPSEAARQIDGKGSVRAARAATQDFRKACADLSRILASPRGADLMARLR